VFLQEQSEEVNFAVPLVLEVEAPHLPGSHLPSSTLWNDISLQVRLLTISLFFAEPPRSQFRLFFLMIASCIYYV
jgi:hypothetical protein